MSATNGTHTSADRLGVEVLHDLAQLRNENEELRGLVLELEQACKAPPAASRTGRHARASTRACWRRNPN